VEFHEPRDISQHDRQGRRTTVEFTINHVQSLLSQYWIHVLNGLTVPRRSCYSRYTRRARSHTSQRCADSKTVGPPSCRSSATCHVEWPAVGSRFCNLSRTTTRPVYRNKPNTGNIMGFMYVKTISSFTNASLTYLPVKTSVLNKVYGHLTDTLWAVRRLHWSVALVS